MNKEEAAYTLALRTFFYFALENIPPCAPVSAHTHTAETKIKVTMDERKTMDEMTELAPYMRKIISQLETDKKLPAVHTYTCTLNSVTAFVAGKEEEDSKEKETAKPQEEGSTTEIPLPMEDIFTPGRLKEYEEYLRRRRREWGTVSTYMRTLQAVYNRRTPPGHPNHNPTLFKNVYTKVESHTKRSLTKEQMETLMYADFSKLPKEIQEALAYFLLMFLLRGMPFIDFAYMQKSDVKGDFLVYCRHKTGRKMVVHIPREAKALLEAYRNKNATSPYLFPIMDSKAVIKNDKELYKHYLCALRNFNRKLIRIKELLPERIKISSYTPRHTWATLAFYQGLPVGIISKALGHSSIKVTETYLKPFENEKVDTANDELIISITSHREGA